jgi:hypothetical protein
MAIQANEYYYDGQLTRYINQFMAIFQGLQVQIGKWQAQEIRLIPVPIHYGHMDTVVAALITDNTQNKPLKLPIMSAYVSGLTLNMSRAHGVGNQRRTSYVPVGGLVPDDIKVVHQRMPVFYDLSIDLNIFVSNTNQHLQILEQILPLFDPSLNLQTSDAIFDWTRLTQVELKDITLDTNFPIGTDRRIIQSKISFNIPLWIDIPAEVRRDFVEKIFLRIGTVSTSASIDNSYDLIAELDATGGDYTLVATDENLPFE